MAQRRVTLVEDRRAPKIHNTCGLAFTLENERVQTRQRSLTMHLKGCNHLSRIEEIYMRIKSILLEELLNSMRESFTRAEKYFDIETIKEDKTRKIIDLTYA